MGTLWLFQSFIFQLHSHSFSTYLHPTHILQSFSTFLIIHLITPSIIQLTFMKHFPLPSIIHPLSPIILSLIHQSFSYSFSINHFITHSLNIITNQSLSFPIIHFYSWRFPNHLSLIRFAFIALDNFPSHSLHTIQPCTLGLGHYHLDTFYSGEFMTHTSTLTKTFTLLHSREPLESSTFTLTLSHTQNITHSSTLQSQPQSSFTNFNHSNLLHCFSPTKTTPFHIHRGSFIFTVNECFNEISFYFIFINLFSSIMCN